MASLFVTRNEAARKRAVSRGGLGGFVTIGSIIIRENQQGDGKATWPKNKRKKNKPPPISIIQESDKFFVKQEVLSPTPIADDGFARVPRTPISRYNPLLSPGSVYSGHLPQTPQTLQTPRQQLLPSALELPGSLLLPSQGFPQSNPPRTPARPLPCLSRSSSEESDQIWTPAVSTSSATDIEDDDMPKSFPPMHLPRAAKLSKPGNFSAPATRELGIGKPVSAMSAEELLDELPQLSVEAVKAIWIPAMVKQHDRIKKLLQDAAGVHLDTNRGLLDCGQTLDSFTREAHKISHTYEKAVKSAESLIERDAKACRDRLETAQNNLEVALTTIDNNHQALRQKDTTIEQLRYTLDDTVRVLGDFIHDYTPLNVLRNTEQDDVRNVMQMLADYSNAPSQDKEPPIHFLRVPEEHYMASIDALREAQLKTERFREVAINQSQVISEQSKQLDDRSIAYEKSIGVIAERKHEVKLLADDNERLRKTVEDFETGLRVSHSTKAVQDELFRDQEAIQLMLRNMQSSHANELKHRDTVIADLEKKLESAKEEVLRGKADVKNVSSHTQALLFPAEPPEDFTMAAPTLKERRLMSKAKGKSTTLPTSQSMLSFDQNAQKSYAPHVPERRQSANALAKPVEHMASAMLPRDITSQWACGVSRKQSGQDLRDLSNFSPEYAPRPRTDSLGHSERRQHPVTGDHAMASAVVNQMLGAPIKFDPHKQLPNPPEPQYAIDLYGGDNATDMDQAEDWYQQQQPQPKPQQCFPGPSVTQRKRVLSHITERSGEDSASISENTSGKDIASATGSAQEEYLNALQGVRMRAFINETNHMAKMNKEQDSLPDYEGRDYFSDRQEPRLMEGDTGVARTMEVVQSPTKHSQHGMVYPTSQNGSSSTITKKSSPLRHVEGIHVQGDPWLSGSPLR